MPPASEPIGAITHPVARMLDRAAAMSPTRRGGHTSDCPTVGFGRRLPASEPDEPDEPEA
jgi:hypothetical protein